MEQQEQLDRDALYSHIQLLSMLGRKPVATKHEIGILNRAMRWMALKEEKIQALNVFIEHHNPPIFISDMEVTTRIIADNVTHYEGIWGEHGLCECTYCQHA